MPRSSRLSVLLLCSRLGLEWVSCGDELDQVRRALTAGLFTNAVRYESTSYDHLNMGDAGSNAYTLLRSSGRGEAPALLLLLNAGPCSHRVATCSARRVGHAALLMWAMHDIALVSKALARQGCASCSCLLSGYASPLLCRCQAAHWPSVSAGTYTATVVAILSGAAVPVRVV